MLVEDLLVGVVVFVEEQPERGVLDDEVFLRLAENWGTLEGMLENWVFKGFVLCSHLLELPVFPLLEDLVDLEVFQSLYLLHKDLGRIRLFPQVVSNQQTELLDKAELSGEGLNGDRSWGSSRR